MATKNRSELKTYFVKNAIPTEQNFADLVDAPLNQADDGVFKLPGEPLAVVADTGDQKRALRLFSSYPATNPDWMLSLNPGPAPAQAGLGVVDGTTSALRLFISKANGRVGIGTNQPQAMLHVQGDARIGGALAVSGNTTVTGVTTLIGNTNVSGNSSVSGNASVAGAVTATTVTATTINAVNAAIGAVTGQATFNGPARFNNSLDVSGPLRANGSLDVAGFARLNSALVLGGTLQANNVVSVSSNAQALSLIGTNHVYLAFFPQGATTRRGWMGYGGSGGVDLTITSEAGHVDLVAPGGKYVRAPGGALLNQVAIGVAAHGALPYAYETLQLNPLHNLRFFFGTRERMVLQNDGALTIKFNGGYWAFQADGNLVKYRNNNTAAWASGAGW